MESADFKDILFALRDAKVEFLIVGAHALGAHGLVRATGDLDIWVKASPSNALRVAEAFEAFAGSPISMFSLTVEELSVPGVGVALGAEPYRIDLHTAIAGVSFDEAMSTSIEAELFGTPVRVLGHASLVAAKRASAAKRPAGSPKAAMDAADLAWLESRGPKKPS